MDVSVLIPYGYRGDWEHRLFEYVLQSWMKSFPDWEIVVGTNTGKFNRSAARNDAAGKASGDIYIICDADTIMPISKTANDAVEIAKNGGWALPECYLQLRKEGTEEILDGALLGPWLTVPLKTYTDQPGGWRVCRAEDYGAVGGFDAGFDGWGYEDTAFQLSMNAMIGDCTRIGTAVHLWHETNRSERQGQSHIRQNYSRYYRYLLASKKGRAAMESNLKELGMI